MNTITKTNKDEYDDYEIELIQHVEDTIVTIAQQRNADQNVFMHLDSHLVFGTMMPRTITYQQSGHLETATERCLRMFRSWYIGLCRELLGRKFSTNQGRKRQPFAYAFVDFGKVARREGRYDFSANPHIHFLMLLHPETLPRFRKLLEQARNIDDRYRLPVEDSRISYLDVEFYNMDDGTLDRLIGYCSKTARHPAFRSQCSLFDIFPQGTNLETYIYNAGRGLAVSKVADPQVSIDRPDPETDDHGATAERC